MYLLTFLQHVMPHHFFKCNIMMTCDLNQSANNDGMIDQWSN
jgi:hypothetical protein